MTKVIQKENPLLRKIALEVPKEKIKSTGIKKVIEDMKIALEEELDGVAIAAPQIGAALRIFVVSKRAFEVSKKQKDDSKKYEDLIFINPVIVKKSKEKESMDEGCLSVRWYYGLVKRSKRVTIEALDMHGKKFSMGRSGLLAQIFQHETDHLDGILFTDKATDLVEIPPQKEDSLKTL